MLASADILDINRTIRDFRTVGQAFNCSQVYNLLPRRIISPCISSIELNFISTNTGLTRLVSINFSFISFVSGSCKNRTYDLLIMSQLL